MSGLINHLLDEWREAGKVVLASTPVGPNSFNKLTPTETSSNIRPDVPKKNVDLPSAKDNEWQDTAEQKCCKAAKPCKHWFFDGDREVWKNTLSGREKEVHV